MKRPDHVDPQENCQGDQAFSCSSLHVCAAIIHVGASYSQAPSGSCGSGKHTALQQAPLHARKSVSVPFVLIEFFFSFYFLTYETG
jgi:hypothetical protein